MRYLDICLIIMTISLVLTLFNGVNVLPGYNKSLNSLESLTSDYNIAESEQSMAYKVRYYLEQGDAKAYLTSGVQDTNQQYLQSGGDFIRALFYFYEIFVKGTVLVRPTLMNLGVPFYLTWFIVTPIYFLYVLAVIQLIGNRSFQGMQ